MIYPPFFALVLLIIFQPGLAENDCFGIAEIYPTRAGGQEWFMDMQDPTADIQMNWGSATVTRNADSSWKMAAAQVRVEVYTPAGYNRSLLVTDQSVLPSRGYMQDPNDWKYLEMTGYVRLNAYSGTANGGPHFEWQGPGGKHTSCCPCEGTCYHANWYQDPIGRVKFEKELSHTAGYTSGDPQRLNLFPSMVGRWLGAKAVFYRLPGNRMKLEHWMDSAATNDWKLVHSYVDSGQWSANAGYCGGTANQILTWGGPLVTFRWDNLTDVDFKWFSVREIGDSGSATQLTGPAGATALPAGALELEVSPNPVSGPAIISVATSGQTGWQTASLQLYSLTGVRVGAWSWKDCRSARVTWAGTDRQGRKLPAGVYLARLRAGDSRTIAKIIKLN
jgi:hypothetical protein